MRARVLLLLLLPARRALARPERAPCATRRQCDRQRQRLGRTKFYVGDFAVKGCFAKGDVAYFGTGGSAADRAAAPLSGRKERLWCDAPPPRPAPTRTPTPPLRPAVAAPPPRPAAAAPSQSACLTAPQCDARRREMGFASYEVGDFATKGCFARGDDAAFFGTGGTAADMAVAPLRRRKERLWCEEQALAPHGGGESNDVGNCIEVRFTTGELFRDGQAGFALTAKPPDDGTTELATLFERPAGSLASETTYEERACGLEDGIYELAVVGRGQYAVAIGGEEVLFGANAWGKASAHDLLVGEAPAAAGKTERAWLNEHNARRKAFHEEHGRDYRPLRWSTGLARNAADWIDEVLPDCRHVREPHLEEGELVAINRYRADEARTETEVPANIVPRWDRDVSKQSQLLWRATRYVGCATKVRRVRESRNAYCHVSICRYARPGNCGVAGVDADTLREKTLADRSLCGAACPPEGCH